MWKAVIKQARPKSHHLEVGAKRILKPLQVIFTFYQLHSGIKSPGTISFYQFYFSSGEYIRPMGFFNSKIFLFPICIQSDILIIWDIQILWGDYCSMSCHGSFDLKWMVNYISLFNQRPLWSLRLKFVMNQMIQREIETLFFKHFMSLYIFCASLFPTVKTGGPTISCKLGEKEEKISLRSQNKSDLTLFLFQKSSWKL